MKSLQDTRIERRSLLRGVALGSVAWLVARRALRPAAAQAVPRVIASRVSQVPLEPASSVWASAAPVDIAMTPQMITTPRIQEAGVKSLRVRALFDAERLGVLVEWSDPSREGGLGTVASFRDAVAVQFPSRPAEPAPFIGMGEPGKPVIIYQWKSDWQFAPNHDVEEAYPNMFAPDVYPFSGVAAQTIPEATDYKEKGDLTYVTAWKAGNPLANLDLQATTSVEKIGAEGFGTARTSATQDGRGKGEWQGSGWQVVISVPRAQEGFTLSEGQVVPIAFAAWDGSRGERNGRKAFSTWNELALGQEGGLAPFAWGGGAAVAVAVAAGALWLRLRGRARAG